MKRILALFLALSMIFALCACGSKELSAEEKEKIYQEIAAEKAAAAEEEEAAEEPELITPTPEPQPNYFLIEDVKVIPSHYAGTGVVFFFGENPMKAGDVLDYKITNLFPQQEGKPYPPMFMLSFSFLDKDGVTIQTSKVIIENMAYGDEIYASSILDAHLPDKTIPDNACSVKFTGIQAGAPTEVMDIYPFGEPYIFEIPGKDGASGATAADSSSDASQDVTEEEIRRLLIGEWPQGTIGSTFFDETTVSFISGGQMMSGPYELDLDAAQIIAKLTLSDGSITVKMSYIYDNGELTLINNRNETLVKR